jgi:hypothetical protein
MTGKRHHYNPRFLQAGFNSRPGGKTPRAWLYRKGATAPVEPALTDIGVEVGFYQADVGGIQLSADDAITAAESRLSELVSKLRAANGGPVDNGIGDCAELMAHVQLRTKAAWVFTTSGLQRLSRLIHEDGEMQDIVKGMLRFIVQANCLSSVIAQAAPGVDEEHIRQGLPEALANVSVSEMFAPCPKDAVGNTTEDFVGDVTEMLKVWSMTRMAQYAESASEFQGCAFVVCDFPGVRLVQGDTVVVYHKRDGVFTSILREGEVFDFAVLPLTSSRVLVASKGSMPESGEALQKASIRCAWNHFISDAKDEGLQALASTIGEGIPNITDGDIKEMLRAATGDEHWINWRAFAESPAYQAIRAKWVRRPWLRGDNEQNEGT